MIKLMTKAKIKDHFETFNSQGTKVKTKNKLRDQMMY